MIVNYDVSQSPTLEAFMLDDSFMRAVMGPFGSGKSSACCAEIARRASMQKPAKDGKRKTRCVVVRNTYPELRDTTMPTFFKWFPPGDFGEWKASEKNFYLNLSNGVECEIKFRALDSPQDVRDLLGMEPTFAWFNEVRQIPWAIVDAMGGRLGRYPSMDDGGPTWYGMWMDTNPPNMDSPFAKFFEGDPKRSGEPPACTRVREDGRRQGRIFKQPSGLSPKAENLPNLIGHRGYYTNMMIGKNSEYIKVYVEGQYGFVIDGRPVYGSDYDDSEHCKEFEIPKLGTIDCGWDFGLTPACVLTMIVPGGKWLVFDEIIGDGLGIDRFADYVKSYLNSKYKEYSFTHTGDPAGSQRSQTDEKTCFMILTAKGIDISPGLQTPEIRVSSVRKPLNVRGGFLLHPRCTTLRKGFMGGYQYKRLQVSEERYEDKPLKNEYSHPHDALQYVATRIFGEGLTSPSDGKRVTVDSEFDVITGRAKYPELVEVESNFNVLARL